MRSAAPIVVLPRFEPRTFLGAIERYRVTVMVVAPPILMFLQNYPLVDDYDLSSLKNILCGSAPASKSLIEGSTSRLRRSGRSDGWYWSTRVILNLHG